jgi:predicted naringenin-chalcone synthase
MPGRSTEKAVIIATGKLAGKSRMWVAAVFADVKAATGWVGQLTVAHKTGDAEAVAKMDVHAPKDADGKAPTDVKYSGAVIQYSPDVPGLSPDALFGATESTPTA